MMAGALAAFSITKNNCVVKFITNLGLKKTYLFYLFLPFLLVVFFFIDKQISGFLNDMVALLFRFIFIVYTGLVIIHQMVNELTVVNLSKMKGLVYTGKISYGLYCFHGIVITFSAIFLKSIQDRLPSLVNVLILLSITFAIASVSYLFFEKPFLKLKDKLSRI
jgi:peptidoglycan/LPS O-acetylase OafA/YrhL